jgi:hypothetical protein
VQEPDPEADAEGEKVGGEGTDLIAVLSKEFQHKQARPPARPAKPRPAPCACRSSTLSSAA